MGPWRQEPAGGLDVEEELSSSSRQWPTVLVGVLALLVGLGLGNATFGSSLREEVEATSDELAARTTELRQADRTIGRIERKYADQWHQRALVGQDLEATIEALGDVFTETRSATGAWEPLRADSDVVGLVERHVRTGNAGLVDQHMATYADEPVVTTLRGLRQNEAVGAPEIQAAIGTRFAGGVRITTPVYQREDLAWAGYRDSTTTGVLLVRLRGRKIAHEWFLVQRRLDATP
jgi:hypothetical protein